MKWIESKLHILLSVMVGLSILITLSAAIADTLYVKAISKDPSSTDTDVTFGRLDNNGTPIPCPQCNLQHFNNLTLAKAQTAINQLALNINATVQAQTNFQATVTAVNLQVAFTAVPTVAIIAQ